MTSCYESQSIPGSSINSSGLVTESYWALSRARNVIRCGSIKIESFFIIFPFGNESNEIHKNTLKIVWCRISYLPRNTGVWRDGWITEIFKIILLFSFPNGGRTRKYDRVLQNHGKYLSAPAREFIKIR